MNKALTFAMTAFVLVLAGIANAYPTLTGPTGLMIVPTADVPNTGIQVAGDWLGLANEGASFPIRGQITLGKVLEVGGSYDPFNLHAPLERAWGANAKLALFNILDGQTAIGAQFRREFDLSGASTDYEQGYLAWTTRCSEEDIDVSNIALTAGVNWTRMAPELADVQTGVRFFSGLDIALMPDVDLLGEYQTKNAHLGDAGAATSVGLRFRLSGNCSAQFGYTNMLGLTTTATHHIFAGLDFSLPVSGDTNEGVPCSNSSGGSSGSSIGTPATDDL